MAELGGEERRGARHAVVRERLARRRAGERAVAAWRTEPLVGADVTAGAHEPSGPERPVVDGVRAGARAFGHARRLLGEWRVTRQAAERRPGIALEHLHELAHEPRPHGSGVKARRPVGELRGMAAAAGLGLERRLERGETRRRWALGHERLAPVTAEEL